MINTGFVVFAKDGCLANRGASAIALSEPDRGGSSPGRRGLPTVGSRRVSRRASVETIARLGDRDPRHLFTVPVDQDEPDSGSSRAARRATTGTTLAGSAAPSANPIAIVAIGAKQRRRGRGLGAPFHDLIGREVSGRGSTVATYLRAIPSRDELSISSACAT